MAFLLVLLVLPAAVLAEVNVYEQDFEEREIATFRSMSASFGVSLPDDGLAGVVIVAYPKDGCSEIRAPSVAGRKHKICLLYTSPSPRDS